jgi:hypothetical protein
MRLWTLHPKYLDTCGLVALWREGLLAKAVLEGKTAGYRRHPQLVRFREQVDPLSALGEYLHHVLQESRARGFRFDAGKLPACTTGAERIEESDGQLAYEWRHLLKKLSARDPERHRRLSGIAHPEPNPLFTIVPGTIKDWEKGAAIAERPT